MHPFLKNNVYMDIGTYNLKNNPEFIKNDQTQTNVTRKSFLDRFEDRLQLKTKIIWKNVIVISLYHLVGIPGMSFFFFAKFLTSAFAIFVGGVGALGVTGGAHRLWTHRAYKAKLPLKIILMLCYSVAGQNTLFEWIRDHRVHHKFSETDADPHNAKRGFFFSHVGWLMMKKHPQVTEKGKQIDITDIEEDAVVRFQSKYAIPLKLVFCFLIPTLIPVYAWNETWFWAITSQCVGRYILGLNFTWLVNSWAHISGFRPYDKYINPAENMIVSFLTMGEGWHNYHHSFPWDYKAAELGNYSLNLTTMWIDLFAKIGWAYELRQPSKRMVMRLIQEKGDGTHKFSSVHEDSIK